VGLLAFLLFIKYFVNAMTEISSSSVCGNCGKPATLRCPNCIKLQLPPAYFCSQDCFKSSWQEHKKSTRC